MLMLYNSDSFAVVQIDVPDTMAARGDGPLVGGGYEIVDKFARKEIFLEGSVADGFRRRVHSLMQGSPTTDDIDEFLDGFSALSRLNLHAH